MLRAIDNQIISLHQLIVNASGQPPRWWAGHMGYAVALLPLLVAHFYGWTMFILVFSLTYSAIGATYITATSRNDLWEVIQMLARNSPWARVVAWAANALILAVMVFMDGFAVFADWLVLAVLVADLMHNYFRLCEDPPPPKPRTRATLATEN